MAENFQTNRTNHVKTRHMRRMLTAILSCLVVLSTMYGLILPGTTLEKACATPEHSHTDDCYTQVTTAAKTSPVCTPEALALHTHEAGCFDGEGRAVCGYADFLLHSHDSSCYDEDGSFWCPLPEVTEHIHGASCYTLPQPHSHGEDCYTREQGQLQCTLHQHEDSCWTETSHLICTVPESPGHRHGDSCFGLTDEIICGQEARTGHSHSSECLDENGEPVCGLEEIQGHSHTENCFARGTEYICGQSESEGHSHEDACYQINRELICGEESDHVHEEGCYAALEKLTCPLPEVPADAAPELTCIAAEILEHRHSEGCFDASGILICPKLQILRHQHGEDCFHTEQIPVDTETLTCQIPEGEGSHTHNDTCRDENGETVCTLPEAPGHVHGSRCFGTWVLSCTQQEHIHTVGCILKEPENEAPLIPEEPSQENNVPSLPPVGSSGLPVMGSAYATADPYGVMLSGTEPMVYILRSRSGGALDVTPYISGATLEYQLEGTDTWTNVNGAENIPGDASFRLTVNYGSVPIDDLVAAGCSMTYTLPGIFRDATTEGVIKEGSHEIGTITVSGNTATIVLNQQWLESQKTATNTVIHGEFYIKGNINLSQVPDDGQQEIIVGDVHINVDFADDLIAKYGDVDVAKTLNPQVIETDSGDYLEYLLTVTAGQDGCPDVSVLDAFTQGTQHIARNEDGSPVITAIRPEGASVTADSEKMTWNIGDMAAGQSSTLTYRVKLEPGYIGQKSRENDNIQNTAEVYSKTYKRDEDSALFEPKGQGTLSKTSANITANSDGSTTITYYIWVNALDTNNYTLDNVKLVDSLDGLGTQHRPTDENIRQYLTYVENSFRLYSGGSYKKTDTEGLTQLETDENTFVFGNDTNQDQKHNDSFTCYVGSLAPGESKTISYQVHMAPGVFTVAGNQNVLVQNRAEIKDAEDLWLNGWTEQTTFNRKVWSRKMVGDQLTEDISVPMTGNVYDAGGASIDNPGSFTAPQGSYRYQLVANEAGDWDLSSASLADTLGSYMEFVGYARIDTYSIVGDAPSSSLDDSSVISYFRDKTPHSTFWIRIDGTNSFTVAPELNGQLANHAYVLTYYAQPVNTEDITQVLVTNEFLISGNAGIGEYEYLLTGIRATAGVTVSGTNSFHAEKQAWYYEKKQVDSGDFSKGALYWAIKVDGNLIPQGTAIRDLTNHDPGGRTHYIRGTSLAGVYVGNPGEGGIAAYRDHAALISGGAMTVLDPGTYTAVPNDNHTFTFTLSRDLRLEGDDSLYIILKTEPESLPQGDRDAFTFVNKLQSSSDATNWLDHNTAQKILYGSECIFKELGQVFTYPGSGDDIKQIAAGTGAHIHRGELTGAGTYVCWQIHLNYEGTLDGTYRVLEQIPEGLEVAYIRTYWLGDGAVNQNPRPATAPIEGLGAEWKPVTKDMSNVNGGNYLTHYYLRGQQVLMEYHNLFPGGARDTHAVEIQVVCKLTDPDVLLGGEAKDFNNVVTLLDPQGQEVGSDYHSVTLQSPGISKSKDNTVTVSGGKYPFVITLNERGSDLIPNAATITLVDELGENLILDTASIRITNTDTGSELTDGWNAWVENDDDGTQTLKIQLPDDQPLTIRYTVTVNAPPGQKVTITNDAHWEGYTSGQGGSSVNDSEFRYEAGGTAGASSTPMITVYKTDQYNTRLGLSGAQFSLTEMELVEGSLIAKPDGLVTHGTTSEDGLLTFGNDTDHLLDYNTVYRIQETQAPTGYVPDHTPHYVLFAKEVAQEGTDQTAYPDYSAYRSAGVLVYYNGSSYTYEARNRKGEILVEKQFANVDGTAIGNLDGTYRFGLYEDREGTQKAQETCVIYANGEKTAEAKFTSVTLDKPYYVYELDDQGQPITGGPSTVSGIPFVVLYEENSVTVTPSAPSATVTVTNRINYAELPNTGGSGTAVPMGFGALLMMAALYLMCLRRRQKTV